MAKERSAPARLMDNLQAAIRPSLKRWGFKTRGRAFNRVTRDGLTQVISLQMGTFDPPGTTYIPGLRENLSGKFTVNLGVYVPEVARHHVGVEAKSFVQEYDCCVRSRIGALGPEGLDLWWNLDAETSLSAEIERRLEGDGLPFLDRFATREMILDELLTKTEIAYLSPPRIVCAIILVHQHRHEEARRLLSAQVLEKTRNPGHPVYVRGLAERLGLGDLDA